MLDLTAEELEKALAETDIKNDTEETEKAPELTEEEAREKYTPTNAPMPRTPIMAALQEWHKTVCTAEDLPDYLANIPEFHFKAAVAKLETVLMKHGVFVFDDGRLSDNRKRGVKMKKKGQ